MLTWFLKGGPVMYPLLACSVIAAAVIIERAWFWWGERRSRQVQLVHRVLHLTERGLFDEAVEAARGTRDAIARTIVNGLAHHHFSLEEALEVAAQEELKRMKRYMGILDTIITVAPLLGIFGTVTGILVAFGALEGRIPDPKIVASGIAQAVITTVAGLGIAIPTVIAYNYFVAKMEEASGQLSSQVTSFQIVYEKGKRRNRSTEPAVSDAV